MTKMITNPIFSVGYIIAFKVHPYPKVFSRFGGIIMISELGMIVVQEGFELL
jgi:hypothetical protein